MPQTEQAVTQSISIESDLQTAEISYRRYWLGWIAADFRHAAGRFPLHEAGRRI